MPFPTIIKKIEKLVIKKKYTKYQITKVYIIQYYTLDITKKIVNKVNKILTIIKIMYVKIYLSNSLNIKYNLNSLNIYLKCYVF